MTSKTTTKAARPRTSSPRANRKKSQKKSNRINRQRRLQKQLQILLLERHSRRCIICHHPEREAIEEEFVHWRAPWKLSQDYKLADYRTVYRHARAAGLLLQRRERLHSALDAFVESVDDVTFTGDTILRAMRAYSCIDSHGRWTEIPTQVQFSTSHDAHPPQSPSPYPKNNSTAASDVIDINSDEESEEDPEDELEEALASLSTSSKSPSRGDATFCAATPAQALDVTEDEYDEPDDDLGDEPEKDSDDDPDDKNDPENQSEAESLEETTAGAAPPAQSVEPLSSNRRGRNVAATAASASSKTRSRSDATACADSPAQALPRAVVRGQNPNDRSLSNRTDCAALPAQPAAPPKPKPDADGFIWHPRPGYPDQEISEPDAQGRVAYKIHMTTAASQLPSRQTDAQRAAELIYRSVIKKHGNP